MKWIGMLVLTFVAACGGEIDSSRQGQTESAPPCECTEKGCGTQAECTAGDPEECFSDGEYAENHCSPFFHACVDDTDCRDSGDCGPCQVLFSDCIACFQNGFGGDANGTCVNGLMFRGC